jgi:hypothetical protein
LFTLTLHPAISMATLANPRNLSFGYIRSIILGNPFK